MKAPEKIEKNKFITDVYTVSRPVFYFARLCGLWPHTLKRSSPGVETASLLWYFIIFSIYVYAFYFNLDKTFWKSFSEMTGSDIQTYGTMLQVLSGLGIGIISLLIAMFTFKKQWTFFEMMISVDDVLRKDFTLITPKEVYGILIRIVISIIFIGILALMLLTYYVYNVVLEIPSLRICVSYMLSNLPCAAVILLFYFSCHVIEQRFYYVNNIISQLAVNDLPKNTFEICSRTEHNDRHMPTISVAEIYSIYGSRMNKKVSPMSPPNKNVKSREYEREMKKLETQIENRENSLMKRLKRINLIELEEMTLANIRNVDETIENLTKLLDVHDILLDGISLQNEILSFQILLIIAQVFIFEVFALFSIYRSLYNEMAKSQALAFINAFWFVVYNTVLVIIMHVSSGCVDGGKLTGTCLHKVLNKIADYADPRIIEKLSVMSHQLTMRTPEVTCGLFSFNWPLIFSIISATTIYLIFLIQFDIADNPKTTTA